MVQITIDDNLKAQLLASQGIVELVDESGERIGRVVTESPEPSDLDVQSVFPELTPEEIERRCNEPGPRYTTKQVIEHLESRIKEG